MNVGNYVTPNEPNGLVVVTQLQPITVVFTLPEDQIPPLLKQLHAGRTLPVTAYDRSNTHQLASGTLQSVDSQIDTTTGTIKLKAIFPNTDESLFPQQFVNVVLLLDTLHGATLIPQAAIQRGAPGTYVYVVNTDQTVSVRKVTLGPGDADQHRHHPGTEAGRDRGGRRRRQAQGRRQGAAAAAPRDGNRCRPGRQHQRRAERTGPERPSAHAAGQPERRLTTSARSLG